VVTPAPTGEPPVNRMRIVFCGTPQFAVPSLKHLLTQKEFEIVSVYTQPDRPRGRGQEISYSPVKEVAVAAGLDVQQPGKVRAPEVEEHLRSVAADAIVIIAYGQIIPARLLPIPRLGWINLHASLLPKYRGAAPIQWAIAGGETVTGNTTMRIDAGMDTGEMLLQEELRIDGAETAPELVGRLAEMGAGLMLKTLRGLAAGELAGRAQEHGAATMAPMLKREDGRIEWGRTATEIFNRMRGFAPWPGAYTEFRGQTCHLRGKAVSNEGALEEPGTILVEKDGVRVVCGGGSRLDITHVKQEGRKEISAGEFVRGARVENGERFGR
jgi:methionyl-tRNA formyltransferase